ncbi:MAG TPA: hypothetical protein VHB98_00720 [Chloroflexota bacterium]|nr:hypothetical protein [Chloroflexota bacterium]
MAQHDIVGALHAQRLARWRQTPETHLSGPDEAPDLIERVGIATLFPASPELPNLYHAYVGDPAAPTSPQWDSPAGQVYGWRWTLGRRETAAYVVLVRGRPTWVNWALFPAVLRLCGELRAPDDLYDAGTLSADAARVAQALEEAGGVLSTGELRRAAGFPTGKPYRAAYLKAVDELDNRLLLAKVFSPDDEEMRHALVSARYAAYATAAAAVTRPHALDQLLATYLPAAVYAAPTVLAKHLKLPEAELRAALDRLVEAGQATACTMPAHKGVCYRWTGERC